MYTPDLTRPPGTYPTWRNDRPYAALLYLGAEGRRIAAHSLRTYQLTLGVTGPPALGSVTQRIAHAISPQYTTKAEGWETQIGFEPALSLGVRQSVLAARWAPGGRGIFDIAPSVGIVAGNIRTAADVGARARLGDQHVASVGSAALARAPGLGVRGERGREARGGRARLLPRRDAAPEDRAVGRARPDGQRVRVRNRACVSIA